MANRPIDELDRDIRQRSLGCVGASMMAHVGLLALLALGPQAKSIEPMGQPEGSTVGLTTVDLQSGPAGEAAPQAPPKAQRAPPQEVLLAANDDPNAVVIPAQKPVAKVAPKLAAKPIVKPVSKPIATVSTVATIAKSVEPQLPPPVAIVEKPIAEPQGDVEVAEQEPAVKSAPVEEAPKKPVEDDEDENVETVKNVAAPQTVAATVEQVTEPEVVTKPAPPAPTAPVAAAIQPPQQVTAPAQRPQPPAPVPTNAPQASTFARPMAQANAGAAQPSRAVPGQGLSQSPGVGPNMGAASLRSGGLTAGVPQGNHIRDWTELVARPGNPNGTYPQQDRLLGRQGLAVVIGRVTADGSIATVQLERSSGSPTLDQEAMKTFAKWKFVPGQAGLVRKPFKFQLTGAAETMPARLGR